MGYMKIENLYRNNDIMLFKECYALEKVHGTSAHIQWSNGNLSFYSGGEKHENFVALFDQDKLIEEFRKHEYSDDCVVRIHGEAYGGKQQGMSKSYGPTLHFIAFDVRIGSNWLDVPKAEEYCFKFGIEFIPYEKVPTTVEALNAERDRDSIVAIRRGMGTGHIREGVILRPPVEVKLNSGSRIISKHKRDEFRETSSPRDITISPEKLAVLKNAQAIADEWCVPMRLEHVLDRMKAKENIEPDMTVMGKIIARMVEDIYTEAKGEIVENREVERAIGKKTVALFKEVLRKKTFGGE